ncbi:hypothetical protein Taro_029683 [Colocasia esculenta]|uniref:Uncharacterized protein n=1 Tax=Colocasia esculenta TaxID=4460 RepID=A0A843W0Z9_COLES|nr:hypothetical protein [Colocasia esculenta]
MTGRDTNVDDDVQFERLMLGPTACSQSMREAPAIASSQLRRKGSHTQSAAPSQVAKGKAVATSQPTKGKGKDIGQAGGAAKGIVIREPTAPAQKKKSWFSWGSKKGKKMAAPVSDPLDIADLETLDPNAEETPPEDSPRLPSSRSHDSMITGSPGGSVGGGDGDGGGGGGGGIQFTAEQHYGGHCTQDTDHGGPVQYNRRQKFVKGGRAEGSAVDSDSYNTMISDFERMSTDESVGSYVGHSYQPESSDTGYFSGYSGYATTGYPAPYFHPPLSIHVHVPVQQIYAPVEDVQNCKPLCYKHIEDSGYNVQVKQKSQNNKSSIQILYCKAKTAGLLPLQPFDFLGLERNGLAKLGSLSSKSNSLLGCISSLFGLSVQGRSRLIKLALQSSDFIPLCSHLRLPHLLTIPDRSSMEAAHFVPNLLHGSHPAIPRKACMERDHGILLHRTPDGFN